MTVIVYRDHVVASDSQLVSRTYSLSGAFAKIGRREVVRARTARVAGGTLTEVEVYLFGATGETAYCHKFGEWVMSPLFEEWLLDRTRPTPELQPSGKDEGCTGLLFMPDGSCMRFEDNYPPYPIVGDYFAFGTGDQCALGAMGANASAQQAVEIACKHEVLTNGPVQVLRR